MDIATFRNNLGFKQQSLKIVDHSETIFKQVDRTISPIAIPIKEDHSGPRTPVDLTQNSIERSLFRNVS